jgi:hypothetical protein
MELKAYFLLEELKASSGCTWTGIRAIAAFLFISQNIQLEHVYSGLI